MGFGFGGLLMGPDAAIPQNGLTLWLKADTGLYTTANHWADQSGNGHDMIGPGGANNPTPGTGINGHATVDFNGSSQYLETAVGVTLNQFITSTTFSIFVVSKYTASSDNGKLGALFTSPLIIDSGGNLGLFIYISSTNDIAWGAVNVGGNPAGLLSNAFVHSTPECIAFIQSNATGGGNGDSMTIGNSAATTQDGATIASLTGRLCCGFYVGNGSIYFKGSIGEIIIYNRAVPSNEQTVITTYLKNKFGV